MADDTAQLKRSAVRILIATLVTSEEIVVSIEFSAKNGRFVPHGQRTWWFLMIFPHVVLRSPEITVT